MVLFQSSLTRAACTSTFTVLGLEGQSEDSKVAGPSNANGSVMDTGLAKDKSEDDKFEKDKLEKDKKEKDKNRKESVDSDKVKRYSLFHSLVKMYGTERFPLFAFLVGGS